MRRIVCPTASLMAMALAVVCPARAQLVEAPASESVQRNVQFDALMTRRNLPTRLRLRDLNSSWRRLRIDSGAKDTSPYGMQFRGPMFQDTLADLGVGVYYTQWQSIMLGNETYLIAYRLENAVTQQEMQQAINQMYGGHGAEPIVEGPRRFAPDTPLRLSLLNLRNSGSLVDIQPFDAAREIMRPRDIIEASDENLRRIGTYFPRLSQFERNGMRGLPMQNGTAARDAFVNFFHAPRNIFVHPQTREAYRPNTLLAGRRLAMISNRTQLPAFSEARAGSDGKRGVLFLNGRVERVPEARWQTLSKVIPRGLTATQINRLSLNNLQALNNYLYRYAASSGGKLPPMNNARSTQRALARYAGYGNNTIYSHPVTRIAYRANAALSGRRLDDITNAGQLISFYEAQPGADGKRGAVFLNGRVNRVLQSRWARIRNVEVRTKPGTRTRTVPSSRINVGRRFGNG